MISDSKDAQAGSAENRSLWDSFQEELKKKKVSNQQATQHNKDEHELGLSLSASYIDSQENPLKWWKMNKDQFPILLKMARDYLTISAMSTPCI